MLQLGGLALSCEYWPLDNLRQVTTLVCCILGSWTMTLAQQRCFLVLLYVIFGKCWFMIEGTVLHCCVAANYDALLF